MRVRAAGLAIGDVFSVKGAPYAMRMYTGLLKPKWGVPGYDFAGQVEAVGGGVKQFQAGDEVFGSSAATCAEYALAREDQLALKPANLTFEEAAAIPMAALAALRGLRDAGKVQAGQKVLINGASGGVGHFAVQIAKALGAEVTGVCSTKNVEMVRSIGADHVIDYTRRISLEAGSATTSSSTTSRTARCRTSGARSRPTGRSSSTAARGRPASTMLVRLAKPLVLSPFVRQNLRRYLVKPNQKDLLALKELVESGKLRAVIDRTYPLGETAAALAYIEGGHVAGKVVVTIDD